MNVFKLQLLLFFNILYVSDSERRIQGGYPMFSQKGYMVYLVKAPQSEKKFDQWLCGGALVTTWFILTAQSCVQDVEYMYAIAGYNKYVPDDQIETDTCTKDKKKKVVYFCAPEGSDISVDNVTGWAAVDIALAKVESEYDPHDDTFKALCSYTPTVIPFNYVLNFQKPGTDAIVLGWGHTDDLRMPFDKANYNQKLLRYARIKLVESKLCKDHYPLMADVIDEHNMLCSIESGDIDETGKLDIKSPSPKIDGCKAGLRTDNCHTDTDEEIIISLLNLRNNDYDKTPMDLEGTPSDSTDKMPIDLEETPSDSTDKTPMDLEETPSSSTDKTPMNMSSGFCQNDHGGPLVTWVGSKEVLIGVATLFKVSDQSKCEGPYLFTSTACHGVFLHCVLTQGSKARRDLCDSPPIERGFKIIERYISWNDHPAGPSENEVKHAGDTRNNQTNTTKASNAFKELIKLETFWKQYNSSTTESATVTREI